MDKIGHKQFGSVKALYLLCDIWLALSLHVPVSFYFYRHLACHPETKGPSAGSFHSELLGSAIPVSPQQGVMSTYCVLDNSNGCGYCLLQKLISVYTQAHLCSS